MYLFSDPDLQVKVSFPYPTIPTWTNLECHSRCGLAGDPPYIWFRNGQNVGQGVNNRVVTQFGDSYSCAVEGYALHSSSVCKSTPQYTDMITVVMDPLGYRSTCYYMNQCRVCSKRACSERACSERACSERADHSRTAACSFLEHRSFKILHTRRGTSCVHSNTPDTDVDQRTHRHTETLLIVRLI